MVNLTPRWDTHRQIDCNEELGATCPACEQVWESPTASDFLLKDHPELQDSNKNLDHSTSDGKCPVCQKDVSTLPNKTGPWPDGHKHCACGTCIKSASSNKAHFYVGTSSRGCKILYVRIPRVKLAAASVSAPAPSPAQIEQEDDNNEVSERSNEEATFFEEMI